MKRFSMLDYTADEIPPSELQSIFRLPTGEQIKKACDFMKLPMDGRLRIAMFPAAENACGYYRMVVPARQLNKSYPDKVVVRTFGSMLPEVLRWADIIVVQELHTLQPLSYLERFAFDRIVISEFDDNILAIPETNPWYKDFGPTSAGAYIWGSFLRIADACQVSTAELRNAIYGFRDPAGFEVDGGPVVVLQNSIPEKEILPVLPVETGGKIAGWAGGNNHLDDLPVLNDAIAELQKTKNIKFRMQGWDGWYKDLHSYNALPSVDVDRFIPAVRPMDFTKTLKLLGLDLGLAPLADTEFNASRSNIKLLHYAAAGIPAIASDVGPYKDFPGVLSIDNTAHDWKEATEAILEDGGVRERMLLDMRAEVSAKYTIGKMVHHWWDFYNDMHTQFADKIEGRID